MFKLFRDAIFQASPQLSRKRRQIRFLDYWQFKVLHSALICFTNPASPNFFTGRAGFVLRTHTAHLPKSASWICFVLVAVVDFTSLSSTSHSLTELTHFVRVTRPQIRCLGLLAFTRLSIPFQIFILKIFHYINLVHMGTGCFAHGVPAQNPQKKPPSL